MNRARFSSPFSSDPPPGTIPSSSVAADVKRPSIFGSAPPVILSWPPTAPPDAVIPPSPRHPAANVLKKRAPVPAEAEDEGIVPGGGSELKGELNRALFIGKQGGLDLPVDQSAVEGVKLDGNAGAEAGFGGGDLQQVGRLHFETAEMAVPILGTGDFLATPADGDFGPAPGRGNEGLRRG